jgi:TnpA family transposase
MAFCAMSQIFASRNNIDTAGFTDHVLALMHLLGFRFAPRIRDLATSAYLLQGNKTVYPAPASLMGGKVNINTHPHPLG